MPIPLLDRTLRAVAASPLGRAATWPHGLDGYASLVDPSWSLGEVRARIVGLDRQTADTVTVRLAPNANWGGHRPGQHVLLSVEVDGVRHHRCFSVASAPGDPALELTCKVGPASVVARHLREAAVVGDVVALSQARGDFVLVADPDRPLLLVSAGSGITPVLSMLRTLDRGRADAAPPAVTFVHYARTGDDVLYGDEVADVVGRRPGWRAVTVTEHDRTGDLHGRFAPTHLAAAGARPRTAEAYVCGPQPFMDAVGVAWRAAGGAARRFHTESYGVPPTATGPVGGRLRFARSGVEVVSDGRPILLQAEDAGLRPRHGCRRGICHTCVVPVDGTPVRICVTVPDGDLELDL